ncbi:MAG: hypothetical protein P8179_22660 [Candidatus Thiodiazotropha sp.]
MSEEFSMSVSFATEDAEQMEAVEILLEHLDLHEEVDARELLEQYHLSAAQRLIEDLTSPHSNYDNQSELIKMYINTYQDSVGIDERDFDTSSLQGKIEVEGQDHEADDFCAALVLVLVGMGVKQLNARAGSSFWFARWKSDEKNHVTLEFEEGE